MKELKKEKVAVKATAKNVIRLKKLFDMFPNERFSAILSEIKEGDFIYINGFNQWVSVPSKFADVVAIGAILIGIKQLRAILAKEYLKAGDLVVCENKEIGVTQIARVSHVYNEGIHMEERADLGSKTTKQGSGLYYLKYFKRYATSEEVQYFDNPHAEVRAAFEKGAKVEVKHVLGGMWTITESPKWLDGLQYRVAPEPVTEVDPVGKWCKFWNGDPVNFSIGIYSEVDGRKKSLSFPHIDNHGNYWKNYSLIPETLQSKLSNL